jgi:outer membrane lipoprotein-sorting protein
MKLFFRLALAALAGSFLCSLAAAQQKPSDSASLETVLKKMDSAAANFRTTQAEFQWDVYEKVIDEVDNVQSGTVYYRRVGKEVEMMADIKLVGNSPDKLNPEAKYVLFSGGKIQVFQPKTNQVTVYDAGKNRADIESYLVLGFGGSGQELVKAFEVSYQGSETIYNVATARLQLVPKSERVRNNFKEILLWIDLERGVSVQQKFTDPQGDYRLAKYSNIRVNEKIGNEVFQLKTNSKTQTVTH